MTKGIGIETTCDETSIAILENHNKLLSLVTNCQFKEHEKFKGVVPELASRLHLEKINLLFEMALEKANVVLEDLSYVGIANSPGLIGSLMIGAQLARVLGFTLNIPIITVSHLEAHLSVGELENYPLQFPSLGLLLSGGNSSIYIWKNYENMELIGDTMDDALGECFDKVAVLLGFSYQNGSNQIEKSAFAHQPPKNEKSYLPKLLTQLPSNQIAFSFSGLKTSVSQFFKKQASFDLNKLCFDFQNSVFSLVERELLKAVELTGIRSVVCGGGVFANLTLKKRLELLCKKKCIKLYIPSNRLFCTDNGAMIATLAYKLYKMGKKDNMDFKITSHRQINQNEK